MKTIIRSRNFLLCIAATVLAASDLHAAAPDSPGTALQFNGSDFATVPNFGAEFDTMPMTVMCWVNTTQTADTAIINKYRASSLNGWQVFLLNGHVRAWFFGTPTRYVWDGANGLDGGAVNDGRWHHIAFTVDHSGGYLYVDGELRDSRGWTGEPKAAQSPEPLRFGYYPGAIGGVPFLGQLDEVSYWWRALSETNIQTLMRQSLAGTETNLLAYWRFDEGAGTNAHDEASFHGDAYAILGAGQTWVPSLAGIGRMVGIALPATNFGDMSADLLARIEPRGQATITWFEWTLNRTNWFVVGGQTNAEADLLFMTNRAIPLPQSSTIFYRPVIQANGGVIYGTTNSLYLPFLTPECFVLPPSNITSTSATLNASFHTHGRSHFAKFEMGTNTNTTAQITVSPMLPRSETATNISVTRTNLVPGTTYFYRAVVSFSPPSPFVTFTTPLDAIQLIVSNATFLPGWNMQLSGMVRPGGRSTEAWFEWGTNASLGQQTTPIHLNPGTAFIPFAAPVSNVFGGGEIFFRLIATNSFSAVTSALQSARSPAFIARDFDLAPVNAGLGAFGDFDNDGDLDLFASGSSSIQSNQSPRIYRNEGGSFTSVNMGGPVFAAGTAAWGDVDGDGVLDVLLVGLNRTAIFRGDGNGGLIPLATLLYSGNTGIWGDFDHDGDLDAVVAGANYGAIFWNLDGSNFVRSGESFPADSSVAAGDFDMDGHLDLFFAGATTQVLRNDGSGHFTPYPAGLPVLSSARVAAADFDSDGLPDLVLTGDSNAIPDTAIFRNTSSGGSFSFVRIPAVLPGRADSTIVTGDFDNDGWRDFIMSGRVGSDPFAWQTYFVHNAGGTNFVATESASSGLPDLSFSGLAAGDIDRDGRLDLWLMGGLNFYEAGAIFGNNFPRANTAPAAPTGLTNIQHGPDIVLSWNSGADAETLASGLTYQLRIGRTPGAGDILPGLAGADGVRQIVRDGMIAGARSFTFRPRLGGRYYWSVQSIDGALAGSAFAPEQTLDVRLAPTIVASPPPLMLSPVVLSATVNANAASTLVWFDVGTTTNYGQIVFVGYRSGIYPDTTQVGLGTLPLGSTRHFRVVASNAMGIAFGPDHTFTIPHFDFVPMTSMPVARQLIRWADIDDDGVLDAIVGSRAWRYVPQPGFYFPNFGHWTNVNHSAAPVPQHAFSLAALDIRRTGDIDYIVAGQFPTSDFGLQFWRAENEGYTLGALPPFPTGSEHRGVWLGDFNNDGRPDLLVGYQLYDPYLAGTGDHVSLLRQEPDGSFAFFKTNGFPGAVFGAAWGDYDNDGWLDFAGSSPAGVARNEHGTNFTTIPIPLGSAGSVAWADYDNDGWLDLLTPFQVYHNDLGTLTPLDNSPASVFYEKKWGDFDSDGWTDLLSPELDAQGYLSLKFYRNQQDGTFEEMQLTTPPLREQPDAFDVGDFDADGKLDVLLTYRASPPSVAVLRNVFAGSNQPPSAPASFSATLDSDGSASFRWNAALDDHTPSAGLSYNLRITMPDGTLLFSPESRTNGQLRIPQRGRWQITNVNLTLPVTSGVYRAEVQAVDPGFAGGPFASVEFQVITDPSLRKPILLSVTVTNETTRVAFRGAPNVSYSVEAADSVTPPMVWQPLGSFLTGTNGLFEVIEGNSTARTNRFFRIAYPEQ